jgi:PAS domain S-box-containing protein
MSLVAVYEIVCYLGTLQTFRPMLTGMPSFHNDIANHFLLVILIIVLYVQLLSLFKKNRSLFFSINFGVLMSLVAVISVFNPLEIAEGVQLDSKIVITLISVMFGGLLSGTITAGFSIAARIFVGGAGAITGVLGVITSLIIGFFAKKAIEKNNGWTFRIILFLALGAIMVVNLVLWDLLLPSNLVKNLLKTEIISGTIVYFPSVVILCFLLDFYQSQIRLRSDLAESEAYNAVLFNSHHIPMFVIDPQTLTFHKCNTEGARICGLDSAGDLAGKPMGQFSPAEQYDGTPSSIKISQYVQKCLNEGEMLFEWLCKRKDGTLWDAEIHLKLFEWKGKKLIQFTISDITEKKRQRQQLIEKEALLLSQNEALQKANESILQVNNELLDAKQKAEESDRLKTAFLANMSHEIRTPMNAISGFTELIADPELENEKRKYYADIIQGSCSHLLMVVNDILDISRIETGQLQVVKHSTEISAIITQVVDLFTPKAQQKNLEIFCSFPQTEHQLFIETDSIRFAQILNNLISNAIKFTKEGYIEVGYRRSEKDLIFYVKDTGLGVLPEHKEKIFQRFRQADPVRDRLYGGTGLGLAICKSLVDMLGGQIWVESTPGDGACFYFTLPNEGGVSFLPEPVRVEEIHDWSEYTVLVAEDEEFNFKYIYELLKQHKPNILHACDGKEAVALCREHPEISVVLMDIKMPEMDGYEATREILSFRNDLPIIAVSAYAMSFEVKKSFDCGMVGHVSKPIIKAELIDLLQKKMLKRS